MSLNGTVYWVPKTAPCLLTPPPTPSAPSHVQLLYVLKSETFTETDSRCAVDVCYIILHVSAQLWLYQLLQHTKKEREKKCPPIKAYICIGSAIDP